LLSQLDDPSPRGRIGQCTVCHAKKHCSLSDDLHDRLLVLARCAFGHFRRYHLVNHEFKHIQRRADALPKLVKRCHRSRYEIGQAFARPISTIINGLG
jgi:hypothetical protein